MQYIGPALEVKLCKTDANIRALIRQVAKAFEARSQPFRPGELGYVTPLRAMNREVGPSAVIWSLVHWFLGLGGTIHWTAMIAVDAKVRNFAERYTAAWCSRNAASVASFFATGGSLKVNDETPAQGRDAIQAVAQGFMTAFPDLQLSMDRLVGKGDRVEFHWTFIGTNTGPGGSGRRVRFSGFEDWKLDEDGLIAESLGHFDAADYQRQLNGPGT